MRTKAKFLALLVLLILLNSLSFAAEQNATATILNYPPNITLQSPEDGVTGLGIEVELEALVTDLNNDTLNVTFYNSDSGNVICTKTMVESGSNVKCTWGTLKYSTTYRWYAEVTDGINTTKSNTWKFETGSSTWGRRGTTPTPNEPPVIVVLRPENNSLEEFIDPETKGIKLKVFLFDPDGDDIDVQFMDEEGKVIHEEIEVESGSNVTTHWKDLKGNTEYKWRVEATDGKENTSSGWYYFTTVSYEVINVPPEAKIHSITGEFDLEGVNIVLSVTVTDEDGDLMEVGFYDDRLNPLCGYREVESESKVTCEVRGLEENKEYQWYLQVSDGKEKVLKGPYSFTTEDRMGITEPRNLLELLFYVLVVLSASLTYLWFRIKTN